MQDYHSLNGALLSANSVLKRYRYTFKSDALFNELKHIVLPHMAVRTCGVDVRNVFPSKTPLRQESMKHTFFCSFLCVLCVFYS